MPARNATLQIVEMIVHVNSNIKKKMSANINDCQIYFVFVYFSF